MNMFFLFRNDLLELSAQFGLDKGLEDEIMLNLGELAIKEAQDSKHHRLVALFI